MNYRHAFEEILGEVGSLTIDEIKERLRPLFKGMVIETPILQPGTFLYRARKLVGLGDARVRMGLADIVYPPRELVRPGRMNREMDPVFYCSAGKESLFFEPPGLTAGDEVVVTFWQTRRVAYVNNVGYTQANFDRLGAKRVCPTWNGGSVSIDAQVSMPERVQGDLAKIIAPNDDNAMRRLLLSEYVSMPVNDDAAERYKLTAAIGELHQGSINGSEKFAGILYPSIRMWGNGDNLALLPWFVDEHLAFRKAVHFRITDRTEQTFSVKVLDYARGFRQDGSLAWVGQPFGWTLAPGQKARFTVTAGRDSDGDYETTAEGDPVHWAVIDLSTGKELSPNQSNSNMALDPLGAVSPDGRHEG